MQDRRAKKEDPNKRKEREQKIAQCSSMHGNRVVSFWFNVDFSIDVFVFCFLQNTRGELIYTVREIACLDYESFLSFFFGAHRSWLRLLFFKFRS